MTDQAGEQPVRSERAGDVAVVYAGEYLNKLSGERVERECRRRLEEGCRALVLDFRQTGMVNSIGVSILLGVIDAAERAGASVVFSAVQHQAAQVFEMLGLTRHVRIAKNRTDALAQIANSAAVGVAPNKTK
ncbi:MAG: STAS domain-containing protein [Acidobacteria bacterium]|nr:STAS domain-containing protein [Acidobacteriota bacterium]MCA1640687.1 STAS domain-containing protein [Acidobacteriota bacterium]